MPAGDLITNDRQLEYNDLLTGYGTNIKIVQIEGWEDLPELRGEDYPLAANDGMFAGQHLLGGRQVIVTYLILGSVADFRTAVDQLKAATQLQRSELPLVIQVDEQDARLAYARPISRQIPTTQQFLLGFEQAVVIWRCTDPVIYSAELVETTVPVYQPEGGGFSYPVTYPKNYGGASAGGSVDVPNEGDWETWPRFEINGPDSGAMVVEAIENVTTGDSITFTADTGLTVSAGETVIVESHPARRTVAFTDGSSRWNTVAGTSWWPIAAGGASLRLRATGDIDGADCLVQTRHAWL